MQVFLNIVLDDAVEEKANGERQRLGMVVIRGNSVVMLEVCKRRVLGTDSANMVNRLSKEWEMTDDENEYAAKNYENTRNEQIWYGICTGYHTVREESQRQNSSTVVKIDGFVVLRLYECSQPG